MLLPRAWPPDAVPPASVPERLTRSASAVEHGSYFGPPLPHPSAASCRRRFAWAVPGPSEGNPRRPTTTSNDPFRAGQRGLRVYPGRSQRCDVSSATFDSTPGQDHVSCPLGGPSSVSPHSRRTPSTARDRAPIMRVARPGPVTSDDQHGHAVEVVHRDRRDEDAASGPLGSQSVRALSPAVNHPTTTVQALDRIEDGLLRLTAGPSAPPCCSTTRGTPDHVPQSQWADIVSLTVETFLHRAGRRTRRSCAAAQRPVDRQIAAAPAERRASVVVRQEALGRLSAAALSDPLLRRVASRSDQQGPGGANARCTGEERPS